MTQFSEKLHPIYNEVKETLQVLKEAFVNMQDLHETGGYSVSLTTVFFLHTSYEKTSDLLLQLEQLWGVYVQGYESAKTEEDKQFNEEVSIQELNSIF